MTRSSDIERNETPLERFAKVVDIEPGRERAVHHRSVEEMRKKLGTLAPKA